MATEMWASYAPEINAGRWELGTGPETWLASSAEWVMYAEIVNGLTGALMMEVAQMTGTTLTGASSVAMAGSSAPFFGWLAAMEAMALMHAAATAMVAESWATTTAGMIPEMVVNQNRISEATAEATNFMGVNTPVIAELNREYAQFWTQNGASMMTYDTAVTLATSPKFAPPPPPLSSVGKAAAMGAQQVGKAAASSAQQASSLSQASSGLGQSMSQGGSQMGQMSSMMQAPMQAMSQMSQMPQQMMQPLQSMMQPLQSMMGQFMNGPQMGGGLGSAFASPATLASTGGVPLSGMGGGMGGGGMGGGMGGLGSLNGSSQSIRTASNVSGVPGPQLGSGQKLAATQGGMGGGGMGGAGGGRGGAESARKAESIMAAEVATMPPSRADVERERALFA